MAVVQCTYTHKQQQKYMEQHKNLEECRPCSVFAGFTLAFALQLRKKHGKKTSVSVAIHDGKRPHGRPRRRWEDGV